MEATDDKGKIMWKVTYRTWGNVITEEVTEIQQKLRFWGQYFDAETGLHYNRFRYYEPGVGRFISQDPIGLMGGYNIFQYGPNPIGWVDPSGLAAAPKPPTITASDITGKSRAEIRELSNNKGLIPAGKPDAGGLTKKMEMPLYR